MQQFKKGALEMMLLCLISSKETYGYEMITTLNERGGDVLGISKEGTVYPILYRLLQTGLIRSREVPAPANGGMRKQYALTDEGRIRLSEMIAFWKSYAACVDRFVTIAEEEETEK